jgi:hypothetical protein
MGSLYPRTLDGLIACYVDRNPIFPHYPAGDAVTVLFGGVALAEKGFPVLREPAVAVSK